MIPFERITLETKLTEEEVMNRFRGFIEPIDIFRLKMISNNEPEIPYEGATGNHTFKIQRIANRIATTTPVIFGKLESNYGKSIILLRVRLRSSQIFGFSICFMIFGYKLISDFSAHSFSISTLVLFGLLVLGCFLAVETFKNESLRAKIDLMKLLDAREV